MTTKSGKQSKVKLSVVPSQISDPVSVACLASPSVNIPTFTQTRGAVGEIFTNLNVAAAPPLHNLPAAGSK